MERPTPQVNRAEAKGEEKRGKDTPSCKKNNNEQLVFFYVYKYIGVYMYRQAERAATPRKSAGPKRRGTRREERRRPPTREQQQKALIYIYIYVYRYILQHQAERGTTPPQG